MVVDLEFGMVEIKTDAKAVIDIISIARRNSFDFSNVETQIIQLLEKIAVVELSFANRESNGCTHVLALCRMKSKSLKSLLIFFMIA